MVVKETKLNIVFIQKGSDNTKFENIAIRRKMDKYGITQQVLSKEMGIHYVTLNGWLQHPMTQVQKDKVNAGINSIIAGRKGSLQ